MAGWIGQEFAGRTTANGEIFDPMLMTASHRTLPFGTLLDVHNAKTGQTVRVRVNDRGPYVGDRLIDLSYAAAQQIGIAESGGGEIDMTVVKIGRGDREPPAAFNVTVPDTSAVAATADADACTRPRSRSGHSAAAACRAGDCRKRSGHRATRERRRDATPGRRERHHDRRRAGEDLAAAAFARAHSACDAATATAAAAPRRAPDATSSRSARSRRKRMRKRCRRNSRASARTRRSITHRSTSSASDHSKRATRPRASARSWKRQGFRRSSRPQ